MAIDFETLTELIADARGERTDVHEELEKAQYLVQKLTIREQELIAEEDAYVSTLSRRFPDEQSNLAPIKSDDHESNGDLPQFTNWATLARTDAVERAISEITRDSDWASPGEIEMFLRQRGRNDSREAISGALAHLNRTSKIQSSGRAQWVILTPQS